MNVYNLHHHSTDASRQICQQMEWSIPVNRLTASFQFYQWWTYKFRYLERLKYSGVFVIVWGPRLTDVTRKKKQHFVAKRLYSNSRIPRAMQAHSDTEHSTGLCGETVFFFFVFNSSTRGTYTTWPSRNTRNTTWYRAFFICPAQVQLSHLFLQCSSPRSTFNGLFTLHILGVYTRQ